MGDSLEEIWRIFGPGIAGAIFGAGWWFWVDAVVCSSQTIEFIHYLPGIFASLAALMVNVIRREDLSDYSAYGDDTACRSRTWLFLAYVIAFVSLAASAGLLIRDSVNKTEEWAGAAGVLQCGFVLCSGLIFWLSRSSE